MEALTYRPEIDGLRALAVIPVIFMHAGADLLRGGYVGVDVFFVISGYLITAIILRELEQDRFSIARFYERRARRILPALFVVMIATMGLGIIWLLPADLETLSKSMLAVLAFVGNAFFWYKSGYFETSAELEPMLHTWSLAVEEQFYVLYPITLLLIWRSARRYVLWSVVTVAIISFGLAQWASTAMPVANFYLLPFRAWELALGALIAIRSTRGHGSKMSVRTRELGASLGFAMILTSIALFNAETPHPSGYTLLPTLGAAAIIVFATPTTFVGRLLAHPLPVAIGLVSYSAYLWHQPLFALARHAYFGHPPAYVMAVLAMASLLLAYLSWRLVEQPYRNRQKMPANRIWRQVLIGAALLLIIAGIGAAGRILRAAESERGGDPLEHRLRVNVGLGPACEGAFNMSPVCRTSDEPEIIIWGDSYAMHLVPGFVSDMPDVRLIQATMSACGPLLGVAVVDRKRSVSWAEKCIRNNDRVLDYLRETPSVRYVVLSASYAMYAEEGRNVLLRDGRIVPVGDYGRGAFAATIDSVKALGRKVVVFAPMPQDGRDIGRCLARASLTGTGYRECEIIWAAALDVGRVSDEFLRLFDGEVKVVRPSDALCGGAFCRVRLNNALLYGDTSHLTYEGAAELGRTMRFYDLVARLR